MNDCVWLDPYTGECTLYGSIQHKCEGYMHCNDYTPVVRNSYFEATPDET